MITPPRSFVLFNCQNFSLDSFSTVLEAFQNCPLAVLDTTDHVVSSDVAVLSELDGSGQSLVCGKLSQRVADGVAGHFAVADGLDGLIYLIGEL